MSRVPPNVVIIPLPSSDSFSLLALLDTCNFNRGLGIGGLEFIGSIGCINWSFSCSSSASFRVGCFGGVGLF